MWAYLLSPTFEIVNSAGKPATGGWIEVYISGSRDKYYCASDFDGTLHPFKIPLDSLGSNIVLADDAKAYDVYIYNRYGSLLMSRYNVTPGGGGGLTGTITSTDGSIIITETEDGLDLRVNGELPTSMRCTAEDLLVDGSFQFAELERDGQNASVSNYKVLLNEGWWHYDATVRLQWNGASNSTTPVQLYTAGSSDSMDFDLSYAHSETVQISGEQKITVDGTQFVLGVTGIPSGMQVSLVDFGIHSVTGEGAGGKYNAGAGIVINEADRIISVDTDTIQEKLTAGTGIDITDNTVSVNYQADYGQSDTGAVDYIKNKPDLSVYATTSAMNTALAGKQDTLTAGNGIDITSNVVSAKVDGTTIGINSSGELAFQGNFSDIFIAIYGTTTLADIYDAAAAGKAVFLKNPNPSYPYGLIPMYQLFWPSGTGKFARFVSPLQGASTEYMSSDTKSYAIAYTVGSVTGWTTEPYWTLPETQQADNGKVLTAYNDGTTSSVGWASIPVTDVEVGGSSVVNAQGVAEVPAQVNADWNASSGVAEILNKPANLVQDANYVHTDNNFTNADATKLSGIATGAEVNVQANWNETDTSSDAYILNKPTIPTVPTMKELVAGANITITEGTTEVTIAATVPSVPVTDVEVGGSSVVNAQGVAEVPAQVNADWDAVSGAAQVLNKPTLATVATSGDYDDLTNKPTLATVATTGDYTDLTNTPSIPTIGTITI